MTKPLSAPAVVLWPPSLLMSAVVSVRNRLYEAGILQQYKLPCPVISVGNLSLGGEGKTPIVIYIASLLHELGVTGALLSRGYGRIHSERSHILAPGNQLPSAWKNIGDEPALIRRRAPELWAGIAADRYEAASAILTRRGKVVFLLDDGFQHRRLHRDLDLVVLDCSRNPAKEKMFPLGILREPVKALKRAHGVVLNLGPEGSDDGAAERAIRKIHPGLTLFHCRQEIDAVIPIPAWTDGDGMQEMPSTIRTAFLVAAIGNPERFRRDVEAFGIRVADTRFLRDHQVVTPREWFDMAAAARRSSAEAILTTEKDAIKLTKPPDFPVLVARQKIRLLEADQFKHLILESIGKFS